jgi:hypothetical protein
MKWEYRSIVSYGSGGVLDSPQLVKLGEEGWEAVSTVVPEYRVDGGLYYAQFFLILFKRPLP